MARYFWNICDAMLLLLPFEFASYCYDIKKYCIYSRFDLFGGSDLIV